MDGDSTQSDDDNIMIRNGSAYLRCAKQGRRAFFAFQPLFGDPINRTMNKGDHEYVQ